MTAPRIFLSGSSSDLARVREYASALDSAGLQIVDRWFDDAHEWAGQDALRTREEQHAIAAAHLLTGREAHLFWWLFTPRASGSWIDFGAAISRSGPLVLVSGAGCSNTVFTALAQYRDESDDCALHEVLRLANQITRLL